MDDLNCPNCGTTQNKIAAGLCECCGYEFTEKFIAEYTALQKQKEMLRLKKIAEEERKRRLQAEKEEREKRERAAELERKRKAALAAAEEERKEREKLKAIIEKNEKEYEKELKFASFIKRFSSVLPKLQAVMVIAFVGISIFLIGSGENMQFIHPLEAIDQKLQEVSSDLTVSVEYSEEDGLLHKTENAEESMSLPESTVNFFNSVSLLIQNGSTFEEKINFILPDNFIENLDMFFTEESVNAEKENDDV